MSEDADTIWIHSHVAFEDGHPYVVLNWGDKNCQLTTEEAKTHALFILDCAAAAEFDAAFAKFMGGMTPEVGGALIAMREARGADKFASLRRQTRAERRRKS